MMTLKQAKPKWIENLRSGKYKQGKDRLKSKDGGYCCLGVLAETMDPGRKKRTWRCSDGQYYWDPERYDDYLSPGAIDHLVGMNDMEGNTFAEIADWIEANI